MACAVLGGYWLWGSAPKTDRNILAISMRKGFMDTEVLAEFEEEHNVTVVQESFESSGEMLSRLREIDDSYDVVAPMDYLIPSMIAEDLLAPLDHKQLPNRTWVLPEQAHTLYDPAGRYTVPYLSGSIGLAFNSAVLSKPPSSWAEFFTADYLEPYSQQISMLGGPREVLGAALKSLGYSVNSTGSEPLQQAIELVQGIQPFVRRFDSVQYPHLLTTGDLVIAQSYSGEALRLAKTWPKIRFVNPTDGGAWFTVNLAVPKGSLRKDLAHSFINFIHRPEISARLAVALKYSTPNAESLKLIPQEDLKNPQIYPPKKDRSLLEQMVDLGDDSRLFDEFWINLRAMETAEEELEEEAEEERLEEQDDLTNQEETYATEDPSQEIPPMQE